MKIVINIEKKHLYFLVLFFILIGAGIIIATGWDSTKQSHDTLYSNLIRGKSGDTVKLQDKFQVIGPGVTGSSFEPGDVMSIEGGNLDLKGNRLIDVNWQGSLPAGVKLYKNTAGCNLGYTSNINAITTTASCGTASTCSGTFTRTGQTCRQYHSSQTICQALAGCYWNNGCYGTILTTTCEEFSYSESICTNVNAGCTWRLGTTNYNQPLGRLVNF